MTHAGAMATYEVEIHDRHGVCRRRATIRAAEPWNAVADARVILAPRPVDSTIVVFAHRRLRRRRALLTVPVQGPGGGDGAGVREPRRPRPGPGHLSAEADLP